MQRPFKGTQAWFFLYFFCRNPNHMVPRACNTFENHIRFGRDIRLLNISAHAQHAMKSVPHMLSKRWNSFRICSACDKIRSAYAQHGLYMEKLFTLYRWLSMRGNSFFVTCVRWNRFCVCSACHKIVSAYAQHTHAIIFKKYTKIPN